MCLHLGMTTDFIYDYGTDKQKVVQREDFKRILKDIHHEFIKDGGSIQYKHNVITFKL